MSIEQLRIVPFSNLLVGKSHLRMHEFLQLVRTALCMQRVPEHLLFGDVMTLSCWLQQHREGVMVYDGLLGHVVGHAIAEYGRAPDHEGVRCTMVSVHLRGVPPQIHTRVYRELASSCGVRLSQSPSTMVDLILPDGRVLEYLFKFRVTS